jgi:outer membrane protein TolC
MDSIKSRLFKYVFSFLVALLVMSRVIAQESMIPEINDTFLQKLIDTAKMYYPKVKTFDHRVIIADDDVKKAKLSWFDLLTFSYLYSPNQVTTLVNPNFLNGYQFGIFFNFASLLQKPHTIKQAKEQLAIAVLQKKEYDLNIEAEVKSRYFKYVQELTIKKLQLQVVLDAESMMKQLKYKFEKGEETFESYSKTLISYTQQKQSVIEAEGSVLIAKSALEEIIGKKLEAIK